MGIEPVVNTGKRRFLKMSGASITPPDRLIELTGSDDIQPSIAIDIDNRQPADSPVAKRFSAKMEIALVPEQRIGACQICQHDVLITVAIQVADRETRAVAVVECGNACCSAGDMRQIVRHERTARVMWIEQRQSVDSRSNDTRRRRRGVRSNRRGSATGGRRRDNAQRQRQHNHTRPEHRREPTRHTAVTSP